MPKLIEIKPLPGFRLWLKYSDGVTGEVNLSYLAGEGVFSIWDEPGCFEDARLDPFGVVSWSESVDICPDALYLTFPGKTFEEAMGLQS